MSDEYNHGTGLDSTDFSYTRTDLAIDHQPEPPKRKRFPRLRAFWRAWGHAILLVLTICTTLYLGFENVVGYYALERELDVADLGNYYADFFSPRFLFPTLLYAVSLLGFLTAHEMGHYLMCRHYGIRATLPYYLPNPLIFGTFGAVIRIKEPIRTKKSLFDIAIAGPLAGFAVALPILFFGLQHSVVIPLSETGGGGDGGFWTLGEPLILRLLTGMMTPTGDVSIILSPLAFVGWFACLVTAINLIPVSQLDGGHIFYAVFGKWHFWVGLAAVAAMVAIAVFLEYHGWLIWALLIALLGLRHPPVVDDWKPLDGKRKALALVALAIFILTFVPVPIHI